MIIKIYKNSIKSFLENYYKKTIKILEYSKIGTGWVALGYKVKFQIGDEIKQVALRTLKPVDFSHDYSADCAAYFLIQHESAKQLPNHIKSLGVIGVSKKSKNIGLINQFDEFFQIVDWASGEEYSKDLERILEQNSLQANDLKRVLILADYLAKIHQKKFQGEKERAFSLYKRHTRDYIGSAFLIDVLDTYPKDIKFISWRNIYSLVNEIYKFRENIKNQSERLRKIHGDFHPGNIRFSNSNVLQVLDASRIIWGEPADDVIALGINYIWYALRQTGKFEGIFKKLFEVFWEEYISKTKDKEITKVIPLFLAIRAVVLNHPLFFSVDDIIRKKIFKLAFNSIKIVNFDPKKINDYFF